MYNKKIIYHRTVPLTEFHLQIPPLLNSEGREQVSLSMATGNVELKHACYSKDTNGWMGAAKMKKREGKDEKKHSKQSKDDRMA